MNSVTQDQKRVIDSNIELRQELRRMADELANARAQRDSIKQTLDAVITAFFRSGATAPNVTAECWGQINYEIVQNGEFFTIARTEAEAKREGIGKEWREKQAAKSGTKGTERRRLTYMQRARGFHGRRRITVFPPTL